MTSTTCATPSDPLEKSAVIYDLVHREKDYDREAAVVAHHLKLVPLSRVVEFGCGTGNFTHRIMNAGIASIVGVDPSPSMLAVCREKLERMRHAHSAKAKVFSGSIGSILTHESGTPMAFDAAFAMFGVVSYATAHNDLVSALRNVRGRLTVGSRFVFDVVNYACCVADFRRNSAVQFAREETDLADARFGTKEFCLETSVVTTRFNFVRDGKAQWRETHEMRAFCPREIVDAAPSAGFRVVAQFSDPSSVAGQENNTTLVNAADYYFWNVLEAT